MWGVFVCSQALPNTRTHNRLLSITSCTKTTGDDKTVGSYTATCDTEVSSSEGSGIIYVAIRDAVIKASRGFDFRTDSNDKAVIAAADKAAEEHKDQANKKVVVSVVFQPGNAMGEAEKNLSLSRTTPSLR